MPFKLINENGSIHNFHNGMGWGHNIEENSKPTIVEFENGVNTDQYKWSVFHYFPIRAGDFITRHMQSGKIGLYEVISSNENRCNSPFGPDDLYDVVANFCGYYDPKTNTRNIWNGYGIPKNIVKSVISKIFGAK